MHHRITTPYTKASSPHLPLFYNETPLQDLRRSHKPLKALTSLMDENILILGSGMSFHNLKIFLSDSKNTKSDTVKNKEFDDWLVDVCTGDKLNNIEREKKMIEWTKAPSARFCHPREEHLIPLHVCYGVKCEKADLVFNDSIIDKKCSAFLWQN